MSGQRAAAEASLEELIERRGARLRAGSVFVVIYAGLGDRDHAFESLEKCYQERDPHLFWLAAMPAFQPLR